MKKVVRINETELKNIIMESVKRALSEDYNFASPEPQFNINSDEYRNEYDSMKNDVKKQSDEYNRKLTDLQIAHHNGEKGNHEGLGLKPSKRNFKKGRAESLETIKTNVIRALNQGNNPHEIPNFKIYNKEEQEYCSDKYIFPDFIKPIGEICNMFLVAYNTRTGKYESDNGELIEL